MIFLRSSIVSRDHGALRKIGNDWYYMDNPMNRNGTYLNGKKIPRSKAGTELIPVRLVDGDVLTIDNSMDVDSNPHAVLMIFHAVNTSEDWCSVDLRSKNSVVIGRSPDCDIIVPEPYISRRHALIERKDNKFYLSDCRSRAGIYMNQQRITSEVLLREKDCFLLGDQKFIISSGRLYFLNSVSLTDKLVDVRANDRPVALKVDIDTKKVKNTQGAGQKELIRDIHLTIKEGTLVAMLGTAGAGKTTLMNCLNGMELNGVKGSVYFRNVNLIDQFDQMKELIGSVPQQKVFHRTFTPEQEFRFAAIKRLPGDTTEEEIRKRVDDTLSMLSMQGVRKNRNGKLSGGEQTRVNIGIELVADRDLLCLDEPDQGLSPNYKHELFEILKRLARENGKCVLCIIHDVSEIDMFDQLIILAKKDGVGRLAFSGSPAEARQHFNSNIGGIYTLLEKHPEQYIK